MTNDQIIARARDVLVASLRKQGHVAEQNRHAVCGGLIQALVAAGFRLELGDEEAGR